MPAVPSYRALRCSDPAGDLLYVEYETGERELYDLGADPHQLENGGAGAAETTLERLSARVDDLRHCAGSVCRSVEDAALDQPVRAGAWPA
jgi:hypothetical protein